MDGSPYRAEAERWLSIAERLLTARDLHAAKSFAIRARDTEPRFRIELAEQIIAVADTLLAGESRIANGLYDCYGILQLARLTQNLELIAARYRQLALLLNPDRNRLAFADHAFRLVSEAWSVLSNSSKKAEYDHALIIISHSAASASGSTQQLHFQPQPQQPPPPPPLQPQAVRRSPRTKDGRLIVDEERPIFHNVPESTRHSEPTRAQPPPPPPPRQPSPSPPPPPPQPQAPAPAPARGESETESESGSFWTACPYCYLLFEYPRVYEECSLRCQNCKRAFQAVVIPSPPVTSDIDKDKENYYYCWGFFPLGFSDKGTGGSGKWSPITPMFTCSLEEATGIKTPAKRKQPSKTGPWVYYDDQEDFVAISDSSDGNQDDDDDDDDEWQTSKRKRRSKRRASAAAARAIRTSKKVQHERVKKASGGGEVSNNVSVTADGGGGDGGGGGGGGSGSGSGGGGSKGESSKGKKTAVVGSGTRRRAGATELGKLDLNVEFSNEVEEPAAAGVSEGNGAGHGVEDNIEGIGFFEGLDEFLSSLPILKG
ncbi:hypothetical protein ACB098_07G070200 [Castanea mollissima]